MRSVSRGGSTWAGVVEWAGHAAFSPPGLRPHAPCCKPCPCIAVSLADLSGRAGLVHRGFTPSARRLPAYPPPAQPTVRARCTLRPLLPSTCVPPASPCSSASSTACPPAYPAWQAASSTSGWACGGPRLLGHLPPLEVTCRAHCPWQATRPAPTRHGLLPYRHVSLADPPS